MYIPTLVAILYKLNKTLGPRITNLLLSPSTYVLLVAASNTSKFNLHRLAFKLLRENPLAILL